MATYTKQDIQDLKTRIKAELPTLVQVNPGKSTGQLETLYCDANPALVDQFGLTKSKYGWSVVQVKVYDMVQELKKAGEIVLHKRGYYHPDFDLSTIPVKPKKAKKKAKAPVAPVVEETVEVEVEETPVVAPVEPVAEVEVAPVAEVEETVEPMVEVSVPSSVQVSTTTLEPVVEETEPVAEVQEEVEVACRACRGSRGGRAYP